jgi:S1-C subfamily serine protease
VSAPARRATALAAVTWACLALSACDLGGSDDKAGAPAQTTRVEIATSPERAADPPAFDARAVYEQASPGVVTIIATGLQDGQGASGQGSGFVVSAEGEVVTNAHVVTTGEGRSIQPVGEVFVRFGDGNQVPADIVGFDPFADVALLRLDASGLTLRVLELGSVRDLAVGAQVAAIGSPFGEEQSLSVGVISALDRSIRSLTGFRTTGVLQTDAAINQGNSGGPLLDARGRVLGINSQIETTTGEGSGVGFAVSADTVRESLRQIRRDGTVRYAYLGVATVAVFPQLAQRFDLGTQTGAWVQEVTPGGPAQRDGLRGGGTNVQRFQDRAYALGGDVVIALDDRPIRDEDDLSQALTGRRPGDTVTLRALRDGKAVDVKVRLEARPQDTG